MKLEFRDSFVDKLNQQVAYIAEDKPSVARKFKAKLIQSLKLLTSQPSIKIGGQFILKMIKSEILFLKGMLL